MTTKPHPTDAMEMPEPHKIVDAKGKKILQFDDLQLRAERIAAYNLGRESMREEAAKLCEQSDECGEGPDSWDWHSKDFAKAIRSIEP